MKDIPMFTTENGIASLVLKEIPYQKKAYVLLRDSLEPRLLTQECVSFCRICGAEQVYTTGHLSLAEYPFHTAMWRMRCDVCNLADTDAALWPVQAQTLSQWREIYNSKASKLPNGAWMTESDGAEMLKKGDGYFIHRGDTLLGIGRASGNTIDWVAALQPGAGEAVVCALAHAIMEDTAELTVASVNEKAVRLYEKLGFIKVQEISKWYRVL